MPTFYVALLRTEWDLLCSRQSPSLAPETILYGSAEAAVKVPRFAYRCIRRSVCVCATSCYVSMLCRALDPGQALYSTTARKLQLTFSGSELPDADLVSRRRTPVGGLPDKMKLGVAVLKLDLMPNFMMSAAKSAFVVRDGVMVCVCTLNLVQDQAGIEGIVLKVPQSLVSCMYLRSKN